MKKKITSQISERMASRLKELIIEIIRAMKSKGGVSTKGIIDFIDYREHAVYRAYELRPLFRQLVKDGKIFSKRKKWFFG